MPSDLYHQIMSQKGSLENLVNKIPGFKGYQDKQARRTADRLLRDQLSGDINSLINRLGRLQTRLLDGGAGLKYMTRMREVKSALEGYHDRIATAAPKYSGMFAQIKITPEALDRIYAFDEAQFRFVTQLEGAIDAVEGAIKSEEGIEESLDQLHEVAANASDAFDLRDDEILNLHKMD